MLQVDIHVDGASRGNPGPANCAVVIHADGQLLLKEVTFLGVATNNVAEYMGCILGLVSSLKLEASRVRLYSDSQLLVKQLRGEYRIRDERLRNLGLIARRLMDVRGNVEVVHVPREENREADALANSGLDSGSGSLF